MNKLGLVLLTVIIAAGVSFTTFKIMESRASYAQQVNEQVPVHFASNHTKDAGSPDSYPDLTQAAETASRQVAHIKVQMNARSGGGNYGRSQQSASVMASGSGVIITSDGYIVTNNHVVEDASAIQVVLTDKRTFSAKLIGRDPNTDLALVKINATGLSPVKLGNSDDVRIGQWVLAIGYPFSLNTTVTAGIVSAKERSIGIIGSKQGNESQVAGAAVEAFIQTDAAINPGNSGGALVNTAGELIGINAAIASQTGSYAGYGFAIPVNLAKKIVSDIRQYGTVKRGLLGVAFPSPATEDQVLKQRGINPGTVKGVYITGVQPESAAAAAGLREGDIIRDIDGNTVNSSVELSERIARHHPGDKVSLKYQRGDRELTATATLKAQSSNENPVENSTALNDIYNKLGAKFAPLDERLKQRYDISSGMVVTATLRGGFFEQIGIPPGSIIVSINGQQTNTPFELNKALMSASRGTVRIACVMPDGSKVLFNLSLGA